MLGRLALVCHYRHETIDAVVHCLLSSGFTVIVTAQEDAGLQAAAKLQPRLIIVSTRCCSQHRLDIWRRVICDPDTFLVVFGESREGQDIVMRWRPGLTTT